MDRNRRAGGIGFSASAFFFLIHVFVRTWLFSGSVPNPADDAFSGYKSNALIHSISWPTMLPMVPELPMAYYYYFYVWPAAFASWAGVPLKSGLMGHLGRVVRHWRHAGTFELVLPRLRNRRDQIVGSLIILNGCSLSFLLGLAMRTGPKHWIQEQGMISHRYGLYLRVPQATSEYRDPFIPFTTGVLIVALFFLWRLIEDRRLGWPQAIFVTMALASLAGYCTFHLVGFVLVVVPVLTIAAIAIQRRESLRRWFPPFIALGLASLALCCPLVYQLIHRAPGGRMERFRDPLLVWLPGALGHLGFGVIAGLALLALLSAALSNILVWPVLFRGDGKSLPTFVKCLLGIFFLGTFVCFFGVIDDFVPKFGTFVATAAILAFLSLEKPPKWSYPVVVCGLIGPCLLILNTARANFAGDKQDPIWRTLDQIGAQTHEVVLYDVPAPERMRRTPWQDEAPYFSRIQFLSPADQVDEQDRNFMVDPAQLKTLPPTQVRLRALAGGSSTYLLLRMADAPPAGERLYSSNLFSLDRVSFK